MTLMRSASFDQLDSRTAYLLWQLRERVFVVEQECAYLDLDGRDLDPGTCHLWIEDDGVPVAYLRVLDDADAERGDPADSSDAADTADVARIGRVLVAESHRGQGLAERLVRAALDTVGDRGVRLDAQSYLVAWYRRLGFEPAGAEFIEDGIPHVPMRLSRA